MVAQFFPLTSQDFAIGGANDLLLVGASFDRIYDWATFVGPPTCGEEPATFLGLNLFAEILNSAGTVLDSFTVTPSAGDATGIFRLQLSPSQTTTTLRDNAVNWIFRMEDIGPTINQALIYASFKVT